MLLTTVRGIWGAFRITDAKTVAGVHEGPIDAIHETFTTQLESAGIFGNLAAGIVGHEKPRITRGLYSGGAALEGKRGNEEGEAPFPSRTTTLKSR